MITLDILFGSTSDEEKVIPGLIKATKHNSDLRINVHYASADNTPEKVESIMLDLVASSSEPQVFPGGAGMSNLLTGVEKTYATKGDLTVGIPITDSKTDGLSAILSTVEKPPFNPVLAVGLDNSYAGAQIAHNFLKGDYNRERVALLTRSAYGRGSELLKRVAKLEESLNKFGVPYQLMDFESLSSSDIVLSPYIPNGADEWRQEINVDHMLGRGIQVIVPGSLRNWLDQYTHQVMSRMETTGFVGIEAFDNAAIVAATLLRHQESLDTIYEQRQARADKLRAHKGLTVVNGEVYNKR